MSSDTQNNREPNHFDSLWSGRRDSNSRQPAWKADALPTELLPHVYFAHKIYLTIKLIQNQEFLSFLQLILYN